MPLRIQCPNGCIIRVPAKRAGMSARCPGCKAIVVVPYPPADHPPNELLLALFSSSQQPPTPQSAIDVVQLPEISDAAATQSDSVRRLPVVPPVIQLSDEQLDEPKVGQFETTGAEDSTGSKNPKRDPFAIKLSGADEGENQNSSSLSAGAAIVKRTQQAQADRVTLTRFFAGFLVFVGLVNLAPAVYCWWQWSQADAGILLPRWIYLQIFVSILHIVYAVLLLQVPDWSTLQSIAIVMLVFAFVFGLFSMGLVTRGSNGMLSQFLQVPGSLSGKASIWCVAMLVLATLASYLAGREANHWQRTEKLLAEVLGRGK